MINLLVLRMMDAPWCVATLIISALSVIGCGIYANRGATGEFSCRMWRFFEAGEIAKAGESCKFAGIKLIPTSELNKLFGLRGAVRPKR